MDKTAEDLKVRTKRFAMAVLDFIETLPRRPADETLSRQLARSGLGVAGNYRSSCRARSHAEFTARLGIVLEEADESGLWLEVASERRMGDATKRAWLLDESRQRRAIFSKACTTAASATFVGDSQGSHFLPAILQSCNCRIAGCLATPK